MLISNYINIINNNKGVSKYMLNKILKSKKAFTIVEVVLVLAIAGVIMAVVFLAVPALQAGQRDQSRKTDANNVLLGMTTFQGNNSGQVPNASTLTTDGTTWAVPNLKLSGAASGVGTGGSDVWLARYSNNTLAGKFTTTRVVPGQVFVIVGAKCATNSAATSGNGQMTSGATNQVAVIVQMDNGTDFWCVQS